MLDLIKHMIVSRFEININQSWSIGLKKRVKKSTYFRNIWLGWISYWLWEALIIFQLICSAQIDLTHFIFYPSFPSSPSLFLSFFLSSQLVSIKAHNYWLTRCAKINVRLLFRQVHQFSLFILLYNILCGYNHLYPLFSITRLLYVKSIHFWQFHLHQYFCRSDKCDDRFSTDASSVTKSVPTVATVIPSQASRFMLKPQPLKTPQPIFFCINPKFI